jgi:hypothetical protein
MDCGLFIAFIFYTAGVLLQGEKQVYKIYPCVFFIIWSDAYF